MASGRLRGVAAEEPPAETLGADRGVAAGHRLGAAADVHEVRIARVGGDREADRALPAGQSSQRIAGCDGHLGEFDAVGSGAVVGLGKVHRRPDGSAAGPAENRGQLIVRGIRRVLVGNPNVNLMRVADANADGVGDGDAAGVDEGVDRRVADLGPGGPRVRRLVDSVLSAEGRGADDRGVENAGSDGIGRQIVGDAAGQSVAGAVAAGNLAEGGAAVGAAENADVVITARGGVVDGDEDRVAAHRDARAVFPGQCHGSVAGELRPSDAAVSRA